MTIRSDTFDADAVAVLGLEVRRGVELELIQKSGSWFSYNGEKLGQGRDSVKTILEDNPELMGELEELIKEKLAS